MGGGEEHKISRSVFKFVLQGLSDDNRVRMGRGMGDTHALPVTQGLQDRRVSSL